MKYYFDVNAIMGSKSKESKGMVYLGGQEERLGKRYGGAPANRSGSRWVRS